MFGFHALARYGLILAIVLALLAGIVTPRSVQADTNLVIGGNARVAYANGDPVRVREQPGPDSQILSEISEGTQVTVIDGPTAAADGSLWYQVSVDGQVGYIVESFLADASGAPLTDPTEEAAPDETPLVTGGIPATIVGTGDQGARCRVAPDENAPIIVVVPEGGALEVTDDPSNGWRPVICGGQPGFVSAQFVVAEGEAPLVVEEPVVTEEPTEDVAAVVTDVPTEVVTDVPTDGATEAATEEATVEEPVTEEPIDAATEEVTEEPTDEATVEPTEDVTEEPTAEATEETATAEPTDGATETPTSGPQDETETPTAEATATDETVTPTVTETAAEPSPAPTMGTPVLSGDGIVLGTNGGNLRCRAEPSASAEVIASLSEGSVIKTRGAATGGWLPVVCNGKDGYVLAEFVLLDRLGAESSTGGDVSASVSQATVSGTNGDGLRCRSAPSTSASVVTVLREGTVVNLRSGSTGNWQAVSCGGTKGYVSNQYLSYGGVASQARVTAASTSAGTAVVSGTNGDGLRCRATGSYSAPILMTIREGTTLTLRGPAHLDGWQPVRCGTMAGYVRLDFLSNFSGGSTSGGSTSSSTSGTAKVTGTGGTGVRLRAQASTSAPVITIVPENATVALRSGSTGSWTAVRYNGSNGFIYSDYLTKTSSGSTTNQASTGSGGLQRGDHAKTTANLNLRYSGSSSAGIAAVAPQGTVVRITGTKNSAGYIGVDWDGLTGYMHTDYLTKTSAALSTRGGSSSGGTTGGTTGGSSSIVNFAMQYLGYPYVWATAGPSSFDCSGFTYWVVKNVLGRDIGRGLFTQVVAGTSVSRSNLRPGDLVFFQNTYTWGLSHAGIYIGNNQFIHAQNESTGVVISDLNSTYYSSRWYGAVRL